MGGAVHFLKVLYEILVRHRLIQARCIDLGSPQHMNTLQDIRSKVMGMLVSYRVVYSSTLHSVSPGGLSFSKILHTRTHLTL